LHLQYIGPYSTHMWLRGNGFKTVYKYEKTVYKYEWRPRSIRTSGAVVGIV